MNAPQTTPVFGPPKFIPALVSGFNLVAGKFYLLLLPIALDLFLWFGPHFRLKTLLYPAIQELFATQSGGGADTTSMVATTCVLPRLGIIANRASSSTPNATIGSQGLDRHLLTRISSANTAAAPTRRTSSGNK